MLSKKQIAAIRQALESLATAAELAARLPDPTTSKVLVPLQRLFYHGWQLHNQAAVTPNEEEFTRTCEHVERFADRILDAILDEQRKAA